MISAADNEELDTRTLLLAAAEEMRTLRARVAELETRNVDLGDVIDAIAAEKLAAESQLQQVKADAERYRWLRDVGDATWRPFGIREGYSAQQADAAIDAARRNDGTA